MGPDAKVLFLGRRHWCTDLLDSLHSLWSYKFGCCAFGDTGQVPEVITCSTWACSFHFLNLGVNNLSHWFAWGLNKRMSPVWVQCCSANSTECLSPSRLWPRPLAYTGDHNKIPALWGFVVARVTLCCISLLCASPLACELRGCVSLAPRTMPHFAHATCSINICGMNVKVLLKLKSVGGFCDS